MYSDLVLPPEPIITRWGSWIEAAVYHAENFEKMCLFLTQLDPTEAKSIKKAQALIAQSRDIIKNDLAFIKCHFNCIPVAITKLEAKGLLLVDAIQIFKSVRTNLHSIRRRTEFLEKFDFVYNKNSGLHTLEKIGEILAGSNPDISDQNERIKNLSPVELQAFKFAPLTSCDTERSFSAYKRVLEDCRRSFTFENLKKTVIVHCNAFN